MKFRPSHRNPELLQPEVCELTGRKVPAELMVIGESEGFRGYTIGNTTRLAPKAAVTPTFEDFRRGRVQPFEHPMDPQVSGGKVWWKIDDEFKDLRDLLTSSGYLWVADDPVFGFESWRDQIQDSVCSYTPGGTPVTLVRDGDRHYIKWGPNCTSYFDFDFSPDISTGGSVHVVGFLDSGAIVNNYAVVDQSISDAGNRWYLARTVSEQIGAFSGNLLETAVDWPTTKSVVSFESGATGNIRIDGSVSKSGDFGTNPLNSLRLGMDVGGTVPFYGGLYMAGFAPASVDPAAVDTEIKSIYGIS